MNQFSFIFSFRIIPVFCIDPACISTILDRDHSREVWEVWHPDCFSNCTHRRGYFQGQELWRDPLTALAFGSYSISTVSRQVANKEEGSRRGKAAYERTGFDNTRKVALAMYICSLFFSFSVVTINCLLCFVFFLGDVPIQLHTFVMRNV